MANPEGEVDTARAAEKFQVPLVLSSWATTNMEDVGQAAPTTTKIFQIYLSKMEDVNFDIWKRAKENGFTALALTTDTQLLGKRLNDTRNSF